MTNESLSFINCGSCFTPVLSKGKWLDERCECNWEMTNSISMLVIPWSENIVEYRNCNSGICYVMLCKAVFFCVMLLYAMLCYVTLVVQLCPALCDPMDCIPQALLCIGFILQARIQEWIAISFSRESSCPWDWTHISCTASGFFTIWAREANQPHFNLKKKKREFLKSESCESLQEPDLNPRVSPYYLRLYKQGTITFPSSIILLEGGRTTVALTLQRHGVPCEMASHTPHFCLRT